MMQLIWVVVVLIVVALILWISYIRNSHRNDAPEAFRKSHNARVGGLVGAKSSRPTSKVRDAKQDALYQKIMTQGFGTSDELDRVGRMRELE